MITINVLERECGEHWRHIQTLRGPARVEVDQPRPAQLINTY